MAAVGAFGRLAFALRQCYTGLRTNSVDARELAALSESPRDERNSRKKVVLIDAFSLLYRAFYALPELRAQDGTPTQAVYGFMLMLLALLDEEKPEKLAVVTDRSGPTFREELFSDYKANRPEMPDDLRAQVPLFYELLEALNIPLVGADGYEADDCLGAIASRAQAEGLHTVIVSADRDLLQLVGDGVEVVLTRRGIRETERMDAEGVKELMGVWPHQIPDFKGLTGDTSDNIPGVPGVGPKTASRWLEQYGTVDNLLAHADEIKGKAGENLRAHIDQVRMSKELATIDVDVPLSLDWSSLQRQQPDWERLLPLLERLGFDSILRRLQEQAPEGSVPTAQNGAVAGSDAEEGEAFIVVADEASAAAVRQALEKANAVGVAPVIAGDHPLDMRLLGVGLAWEGGGAILPLTEEAGSVSAGDLRAVLLAACGDAQRETITFDAKHLIHGLRPWDVPLAAPYRDIALAAYLLRPGEGTGQPERVLDALLAEKVDVPDEAAGSLFRGSDGEAARLVAYADALRRSWSVAKEQLERDGLLELYETVELPLVAVLAQMEATGIRVDADQLQALGAEMEERLTRMTEAIHVMAGEEFNVNSPRQLGRIMYDKLGLPVLKRTKTGPSTDAEVLERLAEQHPLPEAILAYRQLAKLKNTYVDTLPQLIHPASGRVHTSFNQTVTATGRLSSTNPNLQNIPVRTEEGRLIRKAFTAGEPGYVLMTADYSQIELRVLAHLSQDPILMDAFKAGEDIHRRTASEVFGVPLDEVTSQQRNAAKAINFGIIYGISSFGLAKGTGLTQAEAQQYIDGYFERYPGVKAYLDGMKEAAHRDGYVTTITGRRRYLPELKSRQWARRQFAERTAMNTPIQGSAADIIKVSMVRLHDVLQQWEGRVRMLLQVHDELVFECPQEEAPAVGKAVKSVMEEAFTLRVPLVVEVRIGTDWRDTDPLVLDG